MTFRNPLGMQPVMYIETEWFHSFMAANSSFWSKLIPCVPWTTVCQYEVRTAVCSGDPFFWYRTLPYWLICSRSFVATNCLRNPYPSDVVSYTKKAASSKMPLPFPRITRNADVVLVLFAVFGARWRSWLKRWATSGFDSRSFIDNPTCRTLTLGSTQLFNTN